MKKNVKFLLFILIIALLSTACTTSKKVKNAQVKELVNEIKKIESVSEINLYNLGPHIVIDIYVEEEEFTEDNSLEVLALAKEYFDEDTKDELIKELKKKYPLGIEIMIRNGKGREGNIIYGFQGSCYDSQTMRNEPPDYTQYEWR